MRLWQRIRQPELFQQLDATVTSVHTRLAVTPSSAESNRWIVRSLVVDVFPQRWLDNPASPFEDTSPAQYDPPTFVHEYPDQALFFAGFSPTQRIIDWLTHPETCELSQFDPRPGQRSRTLRFSIPESHEEVFGARIYSGKPDGFAKLPWPRNVYKFSLKDTSMYREGDQATLYAMGQPHYDNFREARAKLIHGYIAGLGSYVDADTIAIRFVDADGWIIFARFTDTRLELRVGGFKIFPGGLILKGTGLADVEKQFMGPQTVVFDLDTPPPPDLNVILVNEHGELDRVWRASMSSPFDPPASHVLDEVKSVDVRETTADLAPIYTADVNSQSHTSIGVSMTGSDQKPAARPKARMNTQPKHTVLPSEDVKVLRVIVASPSDTKAERSSVRRVLEELNRHFARPLGLRLEPWMWETDTHPGLHAEGPQGQVDDSMDIEKAAIVIGIFWRRFGTPVGDAKSGTEHELRRAIASWKQHRHPHVMIYFNEQGFYPRGAAELAQLSAVAEFRDEIAQQGLFSAYRGSKKFEPLLREHLQQLLSDHYGAQSSPGEVTKSDERSEAREEPLVNQSEPQPPAQTILRYLVLHHEPESAVTADTVSEATGLQGRELMDALHELGDAGVIESRLNAAHRYRSFTLSVAAWEQVEPSVLGFDVHEDMLQVAEVAGEHDQIDRDDLLQATALPEHRLDIAALLLDAQGFLNLYRPLVRGLTFRSALSDHRTRQYVRGHRKS